MNRPGLRPGPGRSRGRTARRAAAAGVAGDLAPMPADPREALAPYDPARGHGPWDARLAAHLLRRAVGGPRPGEAAAAAAEGGPAPLLERLFRPADPDRAALDRRLGEAAVAGGERARLAAWWLGKLLHEDRTVGARLTLFWHDHFATSVGKVGDLELMRRQHETLVARGGGPFGDLLAAMARDPALSWFLDAQENRRGRPNENLAREIMELFTLGVGHYTEVDVREAARALTGRTVRARRYRFEPLHHDPEPKRVLGVVVHDGDDLIRVLVARPECPRFLVRKLWRAYVSPEPHDEAVELLAEEWREHDLRTDWLLRRLLGSRAGFSAEAYRSLVASPVDFVVGTLRALGARPDLTVVERRVAAMGQRLFDPPGVQGWEEGTAWIHAAAWLERTRFAAEVAGRRPALVRDARWRAALGAAAAASAPAPARLAALLAAFPAGPVPAAREDALRRVLADPSLAPGERDRLVLQAALCLPETHLV